MSALLNCLMLLLLAVPPYRGDDENTQRLIRKLIADLDADYYDERQIAVAELRKFGKATEPSLIEALSSESDRIRAAAIGLLKDLKSEACVDKMNEIFRNDREKSIRLSAFQYLKEIGKTSEVHLVDALDLDDENALVEIIEILYGMGSEKAVGGMERLVTRSKSEKVRLCALSYLVGIGKPAEDSLIGLLDSGDKRSRIACASALGRMRSAKAIDALIPFLNDKDKEVSAAVLTSLKYIGQPAKESVDRAIKDGKIDPSFAREIAKDILKHEVEAIFDGLITDDGYYGSFNGQFDELKGLAERKETVAILMEIVKKEYSPVCQWPAFKFEGLSELALVALGEMGGAEDADRLEKLLKESSMSEEKIRDFSITLYRLGRKAYVEDIVAKQKKLLEETSGASAEDRIKALYGIAIVMNRIGNIDEALRAYTSALEIIEKEGKANAKADIYRDTVLYNLGCLYAIKGEKEKAIEYLKKSVDAGYRDVEWMKMDGDLKSLRGDQGFKELVVKLGGNTNVKKRKLLLIHDKHLDGPTRVVPIEPQGGIESVPAPQNPWAPID